MTSTSTSIAQLKSGGTLGPIYPQSVEEVYRFAKMALTSGMLKPQKIGYGQGATIEDADATLARGTMIVLQGMEIGVPPMQAIQLLAMINGRITAHSEAVPGILLAKGFKIKTTWSGTEMQDDWTCTVDLTRPDGSVHTASFSVARAKRAGLWDECPTKESYGKVKQNDSAWFRYPDRMLKARALGFAGKDGGSDALRGIQVREEADDMAHVEDMRDITPSATKPQPSNIEPPDPDAPVEPTKTVTVEPVYDEPIVDPEGFLAKLEESRSLVDSIEELQELIAANIDAINQLPPGLKARAMKLLEVD